MSFDIKWLIGIWVFFQNIPPVFWGAFLGSLLSFTGVVITNRASEKRQKKQFIHERDLRNGDRDLAMRKDIYLSAAEAMSAGLIFLGKMSNPKLPIEDLMQDYSNKTPVIAKVHVIAREDTSKAVAEAAGELAATIMRLIIKRIPISLQSQNIESLSQQIAIMEKERDRWLELMKQHALDGQNDERRWKMINDNFKFEQDKILDMISQNNQSSLHLQNQIIEFAREAVSESYRLSKFIISAALEMRKELGIVTNDAAFAKIFEDSIRKREAVISDVFEAAKKIAASPA